VTAAPRCLAGPPRCCFVAILVWLLGCCLTGPRRAEASVRTGRPCVSR
jgi:hypothetical protein